MLLRSLANHPCQKAGPGGERDFLSLLCKFYHVVALGWEWLPMLKAEEE